MTTSFDVEEGGRLDRGMHAIITGSGSALIDPQRGGASVAVVIDGIVLQLDCGRGVMENLTRGGVNPLAIDTLFLTHLHFDHIASYGYLVISSWIAGREEPLRVYGPTGTAAMSESSVFGTHGVDVGFVEGLVATWPAGVPGCPRPTPPIEVREIGSGVVLERERFSVEAADTYHYREHGVVSLAYRIESEYGSVVVTGDGRPSDELRELAEGADLLIAECAKPDPDMMSAGKLTSDGTDAGHMTPSTLGEMARAADVKRVVATHLGPFTSLPAAFEMSRIYYGDVQPPPTFWSDFADRIRARYDGDVALAEDGMVIPVLAAGLTRLPNDR